MPRKLKYPEQAVFLFPAGTFAAIERAISDVEDRSEFIRGAVERELERRGERRDASQLWPSERKPRRAKKALPE